jgi:type II secretory pathway component PulF
MSIATSRLCITLGALLETGVPIASALPHAARACGDAAIEKRLQEARLLVLHGERLSRALARERAVSALAARLVHAGEESGRLSGLLAHAGRLEQDHATRRVQSLVRVIEPALIIGFGGLVALVAASLLQALYSVRPSP